MLRIFTIMKIPELKSESDSLKGYLNAYSYNLVTQDLLVEAIKKDKINTSENALLVVDNESDYERADRILVTAKKHRYDEASLELLRIGLIIITPYIVNFLSVIPQKNISYTLKRSEYKDRTYHFQLCFNGDLKVHLVA